MAKTKPTPMTPPVAMPKGGGGNLKKGGMKGGKKCRVACAALAIASLAALSGCANLSQGGKNFLTGVQGTGSAIIGGNTKATVILEPIAADPTLVQVPTQIADAPPAITVQSRKIYTPVALSQREK